LFTVKSRDSADTARQIEPLLDDAIVVSIQNGINQSTLLQFIRPDRLLVGMTATNMALVEPGVVSLQRNGISVIGSPTGDVPAAVVNRASELLGRSGLPFEASDNILGVQYNKLLMNTMGYTSVVSSSDFIRDGILSRAWRNEVALPLLNEGLAVLGAAGIQLQRTRGISDVLRFKRLLHAFNAPLLDRTVLWFLNTVVRPKPIVYSVYQDLVRNKPTEIDYVNGEIVRLAKSCSIAAPCNQLVVRMIHDLEGQDPKVFPTREAVINRFREIRSQQQG
jgi:2-dehydropantoate 2-reductase